MKALFFTFMLTCICPSMGHSMGSFAETRAPIRITRDNEPRPTHPRKPERIIIDCVYDDTTEKLLFHFLDDIGETTIIVTNTSTGESFLEICASTPGSCAVALSGDQGTYTIQIEDATGCYYTGSFIIE